MTSEFQKATESIFFKSQKTGDSRFGEIVQPLDALAKTTDSVILAGYPDDEGVALNSGRPGAKEAPDEIRKFFYKTTPSPTFDSKTSIYDFGNKVKGETLAGDHEKIKSTVTEALEQGNTWIGLGGGHDFGYPDGAGFLQACQHSKLKPLVLNFDAHLDVRPMDKGPSSGTPFYRLLTDASLPPFDLVEIGVQQQCNSAEHLKWCQDKGVHVIPFEDIMMSGQHQSAYLMERLSSELLRRRPTFVSIDIDGFASAYAMGCSQSWPTGFVPNQIFPFLNSVFSLLDVKVLGIYEVSPPLDLDSRTVKLAAQILHQFLAPLR